MSDITISGLQPRELRLRDIKGRRQGKENWPLISRRAGQVCRGDASITSVDAHLSSRNRLSQLQFAARHVRFTGANFTKDHIAS